MLEVPPAYAALPFTHAAILVGLAVRGRWRLSLFFAAYVLLNLITVVCPWFWPERFYTQAFWILAQALIDIVKIGIVLEVIWKTFRMFPGAASATRRAVLVLLAATIVAAMATPLASPSISSYSTAVRDFHPRVMDGTIWVIAATLTVAWFYRVPVHPFHRAILTLLAAYTAFFSTAMRLLAQHDFNVYLPYLNAVNSVVSLTVNSWWAYVIWKPAGAADHAHGRTLQKLQIQVPSFGYRT